jgi:hypothetical protein
MSVSCLSHVSLTGVNTGVSMCALLFPHALPKGCAVWLGLLFNKHRSFASLTPTPMPFSHVQTLILNCALVFYSMIDSTQVSVQS